MSCMADPSGDQEKPTVTYSSFSDTSSAHLVSHLQTYEPYNTTPGVEILGFSSKHVPTSSDQFYDQATNDTLMVFPDSNRLLAKSSSFPHSHGCHGLSLSLNSSDPAGWRFGHNPNEQVLEMQLGHFQVRNSKYLCPAKELLTEFCSVGTDQTDDNTAKGKAAKSSEWIDSDDLVKKQSLYAFGLLELHQRKSKLIQMLEEVHRRYKHYCCQMKALVQTLEAVAGNGASKAYSGLASRAMSRHFRCLKDAIVAQIKATKRAIGEKDNSAAGAVTGTTKGETPRLRILDQTLRQQRTYQHLNMMESHPWRPQRGLPERAVSVLRAWLFEHFLHPYPSDVDKTILARQTGLSRSQVSNWFINARVRLWKPMVEEMYLEDLKENQATGAPDRDAPNLQSDDHDQKPTHDPTIRIESGCISSVFNNNSVVKNEEKVDNSNKYHHPNGFSAVNFADAYSVMQFYNNHQCTSTATGNTSNALNGGGGRGVSLTLGLHGGGGGFSPASQRSLFLSREEMEDCGTELYSSSLLDSENQSLVQYRNLMGAQFLHDLAG